MAISLQLLGKSADDLTFEDMKSYFIEERVETDRLEFKSYRSGTNDDHIKAENTIILTISSFFNSSGGLIIWGAPEGKKRDIGDKKEKVFKGAPNPVTKEI